MASVLQQPEVGSGKARNKRKSLSGGPGDGFVSEEARRLAEQVRTGRERQKQVLNLQRQRVLSQTKSQPGRHIALEAALAQIEAQIARLG